MFGAPCSCVVSKSTCWRRVRRVGAGDLGLGALAGEQRLHAHACRCAEPKPSDDPVERAVAGDLGALGAEDPRLLVEVLAADVAQAGVLADDELDDGVEQRLALVVAGQVLLPDLGLGALLEHDQHAPAAATVPAARGDRGQQDRRLDAHAARDVHERAARPSRRSLQRGEGVVGARRSCRGAARPARDARSRATRQRQHDRRRPRRPRRSPARRRPASSSTRAVGRLEQRCAARDSSPPSAGRRRDSASSVKSPEVGELPARRAP